MKPEASIDPRMMQDDEVLIEGYKKLQECILDFRDVIKKTNACREYCDKKHFSVSGISYADKVENCCNSQEQMVKKLDEFAELLISVVDKDTLQEFKSKEYAELFKETLKQSKK